MFKKCPMCGFKWKTRKNFLDDENIQFVGYQKYLGVYGGGYLLFKHKSKICGTTIAVKAAFFSEGGNSAQRFKRILNKHSDE